MFLAILMTYMSELWIRKVDDSTSNIYKTDSPFQFLEKWYLFGTSIYFHTIIFNHLKQNGGSCLWSDIVKLYLSCDIVSNFLAKGKRETIQIYKDDINENNQLEGVRIVNESFNIDIEYFIDKS